MAHSAGTDAGRLGHRAIRALIDARAAQSGGGGYHGGTCGACMDARAGAVLAATASIGMGASVGREGPAVHLGARRLGGHA